MSRSVLLTVLGFILLLAIFFGFYFLPVKPGSWGNLTVSPAQTVTVVGQASSQLKNEQAAFTAGVYTVSDDRQKAVDEVNKKTADIIAAVKAFGVAAGDIKTQSVSVSQSEETYYDNGIQKFRPGQWRVSNSIEITLRDVAKATALADLLSASGANNVYGPNFTLTDEARNSDAALLADAVKDAKMKAERVATDNGRKVGKIVSILEGSAASVSPVFDGFARGLGGGGGTPMEPGSQKLAKTATVVFELD